MKVPFFLLSLSLVFIGCNGQKRSEVVAERYIHKYGYAVSKQDWETKNYPGQVITTLRDGVTITSTYENGILHGPCTHTYPQSQVIKTSYLYNEGAIVKEISYDMHGMPVQEEVRLSPTRFAITLWYADGAPMSIEEYAGDELLEGEYFTASQEVESRVEKGAGKRLRRSPQGTLLSRDDFEGGYVVMRETFYPNGAPESISHFVNNQLHGEKSTFALTGEPLSVEEWKEGKQHGKSSYFKNGTKYLEATFVAGMKHGLETHYIDGAIVAQEIQWYQNRPHGQSIYYIDGDTHSEWYYDGQLVSQRRFEEMNRVDELLDRHLAEPDAIR